MNSFVESLRRLSGGAPRDDDVSGGPTSPRQNVWSSTFDPGSNANMKKVGASYYDKPDPNNPGNVWDQHLKSKAASGGGGSEPNTPTKSMGSGDMDAESLRKMFTADRVDAALKQLNASGSGKVDYNQFMSIMKQSSQ